MKRATITLLLALLVLAAAAGEDARASTLYVQRVAFADAGDISLGDLLRASGTVPAAARETLARSVAILGDKVLYVPVAAYRPWLEEAFGADPIVVGSRSVVIPRGAIPDAEAYLFDRLADWLEREGLLGAGVAELTVIQNTVAGVVPVEGAPKFAAQKTSRGTMEISFSLSGSTGALVSGKIALAAASQPIGDSVKSGDAVTAVFRKGPITIEMPAKALGSAASGTTVSVYVADSQKSFSGRVIGGKAVEVVLP
jgi:hypothetical protein